jgi:hypothetical protein
MSLLLKMSIRKLLKLFYARSLGADSNTLTATAPMAMTRPPLSQV